jgi:outer membrane protein OmpA-like peptidoglycan-associated protein
MRKSIKLLLGAAIFVAASPHFMGLEVALAGPAYSSDKVIQIFLQDKAAISDYKDKVKTRGICIGTAAECPAPQPPTQAHFDLLVSFDFDSDKLTQAAKDNLDQFAKALEDPRLKGEKFGIDGHTDATGAEVYNQGLSERRATAVVSYLASKGIDASSLVAHGFGKSKPRVADPFSPENRRVETHLID